MKKLFSLLVIVGMAAMIACGPSAQEKAAKEKAKQDSIAKVQKAKDDSIAAVKKVKDDSIAAVKKVKDDSIAAAAKKPVKGTKTTKPTGTKTTPTKTDKSKVKAGQGKG